MNARVGVAAFLDGRIVTMAPGVPMASGLVASGGRIVAVGDARELRSALPAHAEVFDLGNRVVLPGFVDAHCHLELTTTHLSYCVGCFSPPHESITDICRTLAERARSTPPGEWLVGRANFNLERWVSERRPLLRSDLDEAVPDHPAVVFSGLHVCTLNTRGMQVAGLLSGASPPRGASIDAETGRATELWDWLPLPRYGRAGTAGAIRDLGRSMFLARGVTSVGEIAFTNEGIHALQDLRRNRELPLRVGLWYHVPRLCSIDELIRSGLESGFGDEWLRVGGVKLFVDGAGADVWGRPVADVKWSQEELDEVVWKAHEAGLQLWMHIAPTRTAAEMAVTSLERTLHRLPRRDHRHRVEHMGDMKPDAELLGRVRSLGVIPVATPQFVYSYADAAPDEACSPFRTLQAMGFRVPGNSDSTGTQPEAANPFHGIWCAMTHRTRAGALVEPGERIQLDAAIRAYTADAAFACHMDDRGTLEPGKLADLVVLGRDPWQMPCDEIREIPVDLTVIGGKVVWERG